MKAENTILALISCIFRGHLKGSQTLLKGNCYPALPVLHLVSILLLQTYSQTLISVTDK